MVFFVFHVDYESLSRNDPRRVPSLIECQGCRNSSLINQSVGRSLSQSTRRLVSHACVLRRTRTPTPRTRCLDWLETSMSTQWTFHLGLRKVHTDPGPWGRGNAVTSEFRRTEEVKTVPKRFNQKSLLS